MANRNENLNRAVGQPSIESPYGGRRTPEINAPKKSHTGRNLAVGLGAVALTAAGVGYALNSGRESEPEPTQNPGVIVEPSLSPIPATVKPSETIVIPSVSPAPEVTPTPTPAPTPEVTPVPAPTVEEIAKEIINQKNKNIEKTSIKQVKAGVNSIWEKYEEELSKITWSDSPTGKFSKDYFMLYTDLIQNGFPLSENQSPEVLALERLISSSGFIVKYLIAYDQIDDVNIKKALALEADRIYDYAVTSIDPKNAGASKDQLKSDITGLLNSYLH